ncbi:ribonuclease H [Williamsoniiplasma somnilux]|uniref:ribonuclease H n=1 Tax=Williamsoniiplasma somnilux TaxID=215578 RepID=A0A2K8P0H9_9MOLU|nr:ribonuclease H family protein [Williamsoniiplasma somnilux]ATZ18948.1 ribonuclease H [Williamsoniiplasma somnilux]
MAKKFYAIRVGKRTGVFDDWDFVKKQVNNHPGAEYKSFSNPKDAWDFVRSDVNSLKNIDKSLPSPDTVMSLKDLVSAVAYTDGSFDPLTNTYSYGVVILWKNRTFKISKRFDNPRDLELRNVAGELEGAKRAMRFAQVNKIQYLKLYHDYEGISAWGDNEWKANLPLTQEYKEFVKCIRKTVNVDFVWVKGHSGDYYNEMVDNLASKATFKEYRKEV